MRDRCARTLRWRWPAHQTVDVSVSSDSILRETSASVGDVLSSDKIQNLPLVGNNVLDLLETLPGLRTSLAGDLFDTVNGLNIDTINVTRDGLTINDGRYAAGSTTGGAAIGGKGRYLLLDTTLLPDLVGEIRLILSPVDAELGRGNSKSRFKPVPERINTQVPQLGMCAIQHWMPTPGRTITRRLQIRYY